ncbi:TylF/MycF/NovP-related O-methyltransferase, partial [Chloroflexota bacterium]
MDEINNAIWDAYNLLLLGPDIERLRKLLVRSDLFRISLDVPGDIVECGVFKGTGLMLWLKLLQIYCPGSIKRVVGFDVFKGFAETSGAFEAGQVEEFIRESRFQGVTIDELYEKMGAVGVDRDKCELIAGDIRKTVSQYVAT